MSIITKIIAVLVLLILLLSVGGNVYQAFKIHSLTSSVNTLTQNNKTLTDNLATCQGTLSRQNKAITDAGKASDEKQKALNDTNTTLQQQIKSDQDVINKLKAQPAPKTCQAAQQYLQTNLGIYQW